MTTVQDVIGVLGTAGFERLPEPLTVAGVEFDFEAAARGTQASHDLVLVATGHVEQPRLQRLVAGLARSLDLAASRRPVSLVLVGGVGATERIELERYARVLPVPSTTPTVADIEEAIAVLLPLKLPNADLVHGGDAINDVALALGPDRMTAAHIALLDAAADGPDAVRETLRRYVNAGAGWTDEEEDDE